MAEQPTIIRKAEDAVGKVAQSVAETLNFGEKEVVGNPGKLDNPGQDTELTGRPSHTIH